MDKIYTGIGSRQTPQEVCALMRSIARQLVSKAWLLRSGGADGADQAFEDGCDTAFGRKEIYLPWRFFNQNRSRLYFIPDVAYEIAATLHPSWQYLKAPVKKLHARNVMQILGQDIATPTGVVICWTPNAATVGGTATALKLADELEIPIVNLAQRDWKEQLKAMTDLDM